MKQTVAFLILMIFPLTAVLALDKGCETSIQRYTLAEYYPLAERIAGGGITPALDAASGNVYRIDNEYPCENCTLKIEYRIEFREDAVEVEEKRCFWDS